MAITSDFERVSALQYKVRALNAQIKELESGKKHAAMLEDTRKQLAAKDRDIKGLRRDVVDAERRIIDMRKNWMEVFEGIEKERAQKARAHEREAKAMEQRALRAEARRDDALGALTVMAGKIRRLESELECERAKNGKLKAQLARDYENSSIPSSASPNHKKIANGREKTGKAPGGQLGHVGHVRKRQVPTKTVAIPPPAKFTKSSDYRPTGKTVTKQVVSICTSLIVTEYTTPEFRNARTGQRVHAEFPAGVINEVSYDGSIKALAFLLTSYCCMSVDKARELLSEMTSGALQISSGMIGGLTREFSKKTEDEQKKAFADMLLAPVMGTDFTTARVSGTQANIAVCATGNSVLYFARKHKGHEGVKGTPVADYQGILVHDHDKTYYSYGSEHQECLSHAIRYLKDSLENEPDLTWNERMLKLVREMIHYCKGLKPGKAPEPRIVKDYEKRYADILTLSAKEYEKSPPSKYYKDGYNLSRRMKQYDENHLLFLHDRKVPADNNLSERLLRSFKRKQRQAMTFRSFESLTSLCASMGVIASLRSQGKSILAATTTIFDR